MNFLAVGSRIASFILQYPIERHIRPNHSESEKLRQEFIASSLVTIPPSAPLEPELKQPTESFSEPELDNIIRREQEGDYCVSCVPSKHLMRAKDALSDALNIAQSKDEFTDVAESKLQQAVYELNAAEKDLELARIPEVVKPAADELHTQIRKLRNFLRQDQSGLELATAMPKENFEDMRNSLETAHEVNEALIGFGYDISKLQLKARRDEMMDGVSNGA